MSALILLVIVAMWLAVLGPVWLRRHDAIYESRSVDKFSTAMRVLARRPARPVEGPGNRAVLMPARPGSVTAHSSVSVSGVAGDRPMGPHSNPLIYRLRRNIAVLALLDLFTIVIWAGVGSTAILGLHLMADAVTFVAIAGLRKATDRERARLMREMRRQRVATVMAREQSLVAEGAPRRSAAPVWRDRLGAQPAQPVGRTTSLAGVELVEVALTYEEPVEAAAPRRKQRIPATSLAEQNRTIDLTTPGAWREEVDLRDVEDEIRVAAMISDEGELDSFIAGRRRVV